MDGPVEETEGDGLRPLVGDHKAGPGEDGIVLPRVSFVGDEDVREAVERRIDALRIDDEAREIVVEYCRFQAGARARTGDVVERGLQRAVSPGPGVEGNAGGGERRERHEDRDRGHQLVEAQPRAAQCHHLGVRRQPAERDQDREQHRHRNGHLEKSGHDVREEPQDARERQAAAHDELDQLQQPGDEQDEGEDGEAEGEGDEDLAEDVPVEDLGARRRVAG